jgi:hypothetical protein
VLTSIKGDPTTPRQPRHGPSTVCTFSESKTVSRPVAVAPLSTYSPPVQRPTLRDCPHDRWCVIGSASMAHKTVSGKTAPANRPGNSPCKQPGNSPGNSLSNSPGNNPCKTVSSPCHHPSTHPPIRVYRKVGEQYTRYRAPELSILHPSNRVIVPASNMWLCSCILVLPAIWRRFSQIPPRQFTWHQHTIIC